MKHLILYFILSLVYYYYHYLLVQTSVELGSSSIFVGVNGWSTLVYFQKMIQSSSSIPLLGMNPNVEWNTNRFLNGVACSSNSEDDNDVDFCRYLQRKGIPWMLYHDLPMPNNSMSFSFPSFERHYPNNPTRLFKPTYAMILSYYGPSFTGGYEFNPNLPSHQQCVRQSITNYITNNNHQTLLNPSSIATAGRTDASVSAKATLITFSTSKHSPLFTSHQIQQIIQSTTTNSSNDGPFLRIHSITPVHAQFHATFHTTSREYIYVLPIITTDLEYYTTLAHTINTLIQPVLNRTLNYYALSHGKPRSQNQDCILYNAECWLYGTTTNNDYNDNNTNQIPSNIHTNTRVYYNPISPLDKCSDYEINNDNLTKDHGADDVVPEFGKYWNEMLYNQFQTINNNASSQDEKKVYACLVRKVHGNRFLRRMMRKLVATLYQDAQEILSQRQQYMEETNNDDFQNQNKWLKRIQNQKRTPLTAPPEGLCLWQVHIDPSMSSTSY